MFEHLLEGIQACLSVGNLTALRQAPLMESLWESSLYRPDGRHGGVVTLTFAMASNTALSLLLGVFCADTPAAQCR